MSYFKRVNKKTMNDTILEHLQKQGNITALEAAGMYRCRALPRRICDLKERGYVIHSAERFDPTGQRYVRYIYVGPTDGRKVIELMDRSAAKAASIAATQPPVH